jgi:hypothetical protein
VGSARTAARRAPTKDQLYNEAKKRNIQGRSSMTKKQLENALGR